MYAWLRKTLFAVALAVGLTFALAARPAQAQDLRKVGQDLKAGLGDAVVLVKIVMVSTNGNNRSIPAATCGTVIGADGLVAVPLFTLDPAQMAKRMLGPLGEAMPLGNTQVRSIKITYGKQPEVDATVVLRDNDLGLALLRPLKKLAAPAKFVDLSKAEAEAAPLDPIITMGRLGNVGGREVSLLPGTVQAVVSKPRRLIVPAGGFAGFGVPAFSEHGKVLGLTMLQISLGGMQDLESGIFSLNLSQMGVLPVILPAAQVAEVAAQAPEKGEPLTAAADGKTSATKPVVGMKPKAVRPSAQSGQLPKQGN
jgi:hypothetical protein